MKSRETIQMSTGYQEAENCERIEVTDKLGHTISTWVFIFNFQVCSLSRDNYSNAIVPIWLPNDEIVLEDVNCCNKIFLWHRDRLCFEAKLWASKINRKFTSYFGGPKFLLPQGAMSYTMQSFYLQTSEACITSLPLYKKTYPLSLQYYPSVFKALVY